MWMNLIFGGTATVFLAMAAVTLWHLRWVRRLPALEKLPEAGGKIRCSVVIAARDEEARIEQTVRRLLAQRGVELEIIVVDDRSTDRTSEILQRLATEGSRIRAKRVDVLPEGWLGKCHACHLGANAATGDWILFTDADCWMTPDLIARAVRLAERDGVEHIALAFSPCSPDFSAQAAFVLFLMGTANWMSGANRDRPKSHVGFGAFNLVRAPAYRECGGYEALRLTVLDDIKLGLLLRRAGKRTRAFLGGTDLECQWGTSAWSMVKLLEKNYFAALDFRIGLVAGATLAYLAASTILVLGLISGTAAGLAAVLSPISLILPGAIIARRLGWPSSCVVLLPILFPFFQFILLNSTWKTLRQGGIRWRETFYPLKVLRAGNVR